MGITATVSDVGLMLGPIIAFGLLPMVGLPAVYAACATICAAAAGWVGWRRLRGEQR